MLATGAAISRSIQLWITVLTIIVMVGALIPKFWRRENRGRERDARLLLASLRPEQSPTETVWFRPEDHQALPGAGTAGRLLLLTTSTYAAG